MGEYRALAVKPGDKTTFMRLNSEGKIFVSGSVPDPGVDFGWRFGNPDGFYDLAWDLQVTDWTTPGGYVLDGFGTVHAFGSATAPPATGDPGAPPWHPGSNVQRSMVMDPAGNGAGYSLDYGGSIVRFGATLPPDVGAGHYLAACNARKLIMDWTSKKWYIMDEYGLMYEGNGAPVLTPYNTYILGWNIFRGAMVTDWTIGIGYTMDGYGVVHPAGPFVDYPGNYPFWPGNDIARDIKLVSTSPFEYMILDGQGGVTDVLTSTAPVTTVNSPTEGSLVTTTSRPPVLWITVDAEGDPIYQTEVKIFNFAQYGATDFDPSTSEAVQSVIVDPNLNTWTPEHLEDDYYRAYVRATERNSGGGGGLVGNWDYNEFQVNVTRPEAPTLYTTPDETLANVKLDIQGNENALTLDESSLEAGVGSWLGVTNAWRIQDSTKHDSGSYSLKAISLAAGDMVLGMTVKRVAVTAGELYSVRGKFCTAVTNRNVAVGIRWYDAAGVLISTVYGSNVMETGTSFGSGVVATATLVAPVGAVAADIAWKIVGAGGVGESHFGDSFSFKPGSDTSYSPGRGGVSNLVTNVEYTEDAGVTWTPVVGMTDQALGMDQKITLYDETIALRLPRRYRARIDVVDADIEGRYTMSSWISMDLDGYWLGTPELAGSASRFVLNDFNWSQTAGVDHWPLNRAEAVVVNHSPKLRARKGTMTIMVLDADTLNKLTTILEDSRKSLLRTPFGEAIFLEPVGDIRQQPLRAIPLPSEATAVRRAQTFEIDFVQVKAPV